MHSKAFAAYVRLASGLLDRRLVLGGLSGSLLAAGSEPLAAVAKKKNEKNKKDKKLAKLCRQDLKPDVCDDDDAACLRDINRCCKKAALGKIKSPQGVIDCCQNAGRC